MPGDSTRSKAPFSYALQVPIMTTTVPRRGEAIPSGRVARIEVPGPEGEAEMVASLTLVLILLDGADPATPEARAIHYLAREVPAWNREHHCFSCHNNGDAARALYAATR